MGWKLWAKRLIPPTALNNALLGLPFLYRTTLVNYETNMGPEELADLREVVSESVALAGDLIECGASRCGSAVITALWLREHGVKKRVYACDSFAGFDPAEFRRERELGLADVGSKAFTSTSYDYVVRKLRALGVEGTVIPVKGYFQQTLATIPGPFCFGLIDCDLEESVEYCARTLFPRLSPGGWLAFDDYFSQHYKGARRAVDRFVQEFQSELESHEAHRALYTVRKRLERDPHQVPGSLPPNLGAANPGHNSSNE